MTLMLGMFLCMAVGVGLGFLIFKLYGACKLSLPVYSLIVTAVLAALADTDLSWRHGLWRAPGRADRSLAGKRAVG